MEVRCLMVRARHPGRTELQDVDEDTFTAISEYLLGPKVYGFSFQDADGKTIGHPTWTASGSTQRRR